MTITEIKSTIAKFNQEKTDINERFTEKTIPVTVLTQLELLNNTLFNDECIRYATMEYEYFVQAFYFTKIDTSILPIAVDDDTVKRDKALSKAIRYAVSVIQYKIVIENGLLNIISTGKKPIKINDIIATKAQIFANSHADSKIQKGDKEKAEKIYNTDPTFLALIRHCAKIQYNIGNKYNDEEAIDDSVSLAVEFAKYDEIAKSSNKENDFRLGLEADGKTKSKVFKNGKLSRQCMEMLNRLFNMQVKVNAHYQLYLYQSFFNNSSSHSLKTDTLNQIAIMCRYIANSESVPTIDNNSIK